MRCIAGLIVNYLKHRVEQKYEEAIKIRKILFIRRFELDFLLTSIIESN